MAVLRVAHRETDADPQVRTQLGQVAWHWQRQPMSATADNHIGARSAVRICSSALQVRISMAPRAEWG